MEAETDDLGLDASAQTTVQDLTDAFVQCGQRLTARCLTGRAEGKPETDLEKEFGPFVELVHRASALYSPDRQRGSVSAPRGSVNRL